MPQQEQVPKSYVLDTSLTSSTSITLNSRDSAHVAIFSFETLRPGLYRTTFSSDSHPLPPFPSVTRPQAADAKLFTHVSESMTVRTICSSSNGVQARIDWTGVPVISIGFQDASPLHSDLPFRSYTFDGPGVAHYTSYQRGRFHTGLGEKAAPLDLSNRHFTLSATDCFGYDVHRSDPLYKHIPLLIRAGPDGVVGIFSSSHARGFYSIGSEMDGLWGPYKVYRQDHGGLEEYILVGKTLQDVIKEYAELVGYPLPVPRWAFGYLAGGMKYSMLDEPRACDALLEFAEKLRHYDIPCSGFQMSSGYTMSETEPKTRNVFTWNHHRFPNPKVFCDDFHARGIRLIANIKPYVLESHPEYRYLANSSALFTDPSTKNSAVCRLWSAGGGESGEGGHIDFTSQAGYDFWYQGVKNLRQIGMDCMWNDNNEYTIAADDWQIALENEAMLSQISSEAVCRKDVGLWGRSMHCELMAKASHDALVAACPHERPFVLTRSATPGTMRFACSSWSGDNVTSWAGMRGANALSLAAGFSLLHSYGHDIGGFEGPLPSPELLLRWVQLGIHSPRFAINCFKTVDDNKIGGVIEPWMYPDILPQIRSAIRRRYELIPYLYSLMLESHLYAVPPQRWTGMGCEYDAEVWTSQLLRDGETQYWLGPSLLIGGVYEPGVSEATIYLPKSKNCCHGFLNLNTPYQSLHSGAWVTLESPWTASIPILGRIGGAVVVGLPQQVAACGDKENQANLPLDDWRGVEIFPPVDHNAMPDQEFVYSWFEDDGVSPPPLQIAKFQLLYKVSTTTITVRIVIEISAFIPFWLANGLSIILPVGDNRQVTSGDGLGVKEEAGREDGRKRFRVTILR